MARPKNPSKRFKRDPTNSQRRINAYERELVKLFKNYQKRVVTDLKQMNGRSLESAKVPVTINPKDAGERITRVEQEELIDPADRLIEKKIPESYKAGITFADSQLWMTLGGTKEQRQNEWKKIAALIEKNKQALSKVTAEAGGKIRQVLADAVINEGDLGDMIDGITAAADIGVSRARAIARTEIMVATNTGIKDRYKQAGVEKGEWLAAADDIVCEDCEALDEKQFPLDSFPPCPAHPNCRCSIIPVIEIPGEDGDVEPVEEQVDPLDDWAEKYKGSDNEHYGIYDENGNLVGEGVGDSGNVTINGDTSDKTVIHNHPEGSAYLSFTDFVYASENNPSKMVVVAKDGSQVSINRPETGWPTKSDVGALYGKTWAEIQPSLKSIRDKLTNEEITPKEAQILSENILMGKMLGILNIKVSSK